MMVIVNAASDSNARRTGDAREPERGCACNEADALEGVRGSLLLVPCRGRLCPCPPARTPTHLCLQQRGNDCYPRVCELREPHGTGA